jgi:hypothetical protein
VPHTGEARSAESKMSDTDGRNYKSVSIKLFICAGFGKWVGLQTFLHLMNDFNSVLIK